MKTKLQAFVAINGVAYRIPASRESVVRVAVDLLRLALPRVNVSTWREVPGSNRCVRF